VKKKPSFRLVIVFLTLSILVSCSANSPAEPERTLAEKLQEALDRELALHQVRGASAAVIVPGHATWLGTSGISHENVPIEAGMIFGIGSMTKNFMATIILQLAEEGVLTLDDTVQQWLAPLPNIDGGITIRQLLNHTSGLYDFTEHPDWGEGILADMERIWSPEETISAFVLDPVFAPGAGYEYSSTNYLVIGMIVEEATGTPVSVQLRNRILGPLGLTVSFFSVEEEIVGTLAHRWGDIDEDGQLEDLSAYSRNALDSMLWASGALYSTAENMARYSRALFNRALFTQSSLDQMLTWIPYPHNPALGYGFGILVIPDFVPGVLAYGHDGTVPGYKGRWAYLPDHGVHIVVFLNEDNYECLTAITIALANVALEHSRLSWGNTSASTKLRPRRLNYLRSLWSNYAVGDRG